MSVEKPILNQNEKERFLSYGNRMEFELNQKLKYNLFASGPGLEDIPENYFDMEYKRTEIAMGR